MLIESRAESFFIRDLHVLLNFCDTKNFSQILLSFYLGSYSILHKTGVIISYNFHYVLNSIYEKYTCKWDFLQFYNALSVRKWIPSSVETPGAL